MLLAIDMGNTNTSVGLFDGEELKDHWRLVTGETARNAEECRIVFSDLLTFAELASGDIDAVIVSSVVPRRERTLSGGIEALTGISPLFVGSDIEARISIKTDDPKEVGADRIANAVAAYDACKGALIVVDLGTAVTFDYVNKDGEYSGGVIAPGLGVSAEALTLRAEKIEAVEIKRPEKVVGMSTASALSSGVFYGFVSLVDGIIERMREEVGGEPRIVATGGHAQLLAGESTFITDVDELLTLKGLRLIYAAGS